MSGLRPGELATLKRAQEDHMMDTCVRLVYAAATNDAYGLPNATYTPAATSLTCGLNESPSREMMNQVAGVEAALRLPAGTTLDVRDRLRLTHRFGTAVTNVDYEIVGLPRLGPSGLVVPIRRVTDGS